MTLGLLLIAAALTLTFRNMRDEQEAGESVQEVLKVLSAEDREASQEAPVEGNGALTYPDMGETDVRKTDAGEAEIPDYLLNPEMKMPETVVSGNAYIGRLRIPRLGLELPVMSEWSYPKLKKAPCRYLGSAYTGDLIIAGHNYKKHFNGLKKLSVGDEISFSDEAGNLFRYHVSEVERLGGYEVDAMEAGAWDLTLFTCTQGGSVRLTVRCELAEGGLS